MSHKTDKKFLKKHERTGATDGGACLNRHVSGVTRSSCSHRWQARERAAGPDASWYNVAAHPTVHVTGTNFMRRCTEPYLHNGHHIIPNGVLNSCISDAAQGSQSLGLLIRVALLEAKYNLNHMDNMIILPLRPLWGKRINLPVHLETGAKSHDKYSAKMKQKVKKVFAGIAKPADPPKPDHPEPPVQLSKAQLIAISNATRAQIRAWGMAQPGATLETMKF